MKELSVSQNYFICTLNENGKFPTLSVECPVCLLAGCLIDLIFAKCIAVGEDKKLFITGELPEEHQYLNSLYTFIKESKPLKVEVLASEYAFVFSDKRIKLLINDVGTSLAVLGCATVEHGGLFGKTPCFIPDTEHVDNVIQNMRAQLLDNGTVSDQTIALVSLMDKSNQIKRYFSKYEKDKLKARLKEIKNNASNLLIKDMIDYVDTLVAVIAVTTMPH